MNMSIRTKLSGAVIASSAAITLMVGAIPASASTPPADSGPSAAEVAQQIAAGSISTNSPAYAVLAASPGFHYVPATEANLQNVPSPAPGLPTVSPNIVAGSCSYNGKANYPHVTNLEASVHGYWVKLGGTCPSTAKVTVDLQALACSSLFGCTWITQNTDDGTFTPGSGTGHWATPHKKCANTSTVGWRGRVDVDLTNWNDPPGYQYSVERDLGCYPAP
jgi:hypothetical protein